MEDDPGLARLVRKTLKRAGFRTDWARDGDEGLAMFDKGAYDVLAIGQNMPNRDGLEVLRTLSAKGPLPPIVIITGAGDERVAVEAIKLGAKD